MGNTAAQDGSLQGDIDVQALQREGLGVDLHPLPA
jgi:hypothetical protein